MSLPTLLLDLVDDGFEPSPPLRENVFYHSALVSDLPRIAREGLRPGNETGRENYPDFAGVDRDCVYFWPNVMAAWSHAAEDRAGRFKGQPRVVLRVRGLDLERLSPDNEEFIRFVEEPESFVEGEELMAELVASGAWQPEMKDEVVECWKHLDASPTRELLQAIPDQLRLKLANRFAEVGEAVMYRGTVPAAQIEIADLNDFDLLLERFDEEHGPLYTGERDPTDEEEQAYQDALDEYLSDRPCISREHLKERYECFDDWPENQEEQYFSFTPVAEHRLSRPLLGGLEQAARLTAVPQSGYGLEPGR